MFGLDSSLLLIMLCAGLLTGFGKTTGLSVLGIFTVTMLSLILPAKHAVGILLPILLVGDIIAVTYYRRTVVWRHLFSLVPWILLGILLGYMILLNIDNAQLAILLGILVIGLNLFQIIRDLTVSKEAMPSSVWFTSIIGILAGFATMIGNVAGAVMAVYLLSHRLPKNDFVGTSAWFFLFVNVIKVPFYIQLGMITASSLLIDFMAIPAVLIGTYIGIKVLPRISQNLFKWIILTIGTLGAMKLIVPELSHYVLVWHLIALLFCVTAGVLIVMNKARELSWNFYRGAYLVVFPTTIILSIMSWANQGYCILMISTIASGIALFGYQAQRKGWNNWRIMQIIGGIGSYVGLISAILIIGNGSELINSIPILLAVIILTLLGSWLIYRFFDEWHPELDNDQLMDVNSEVNERE